MNNSDLSSFKQGYTGSEIISVSVTTNLCLSFPGHRPALDGGACSTRDGGAGGRQEGARELQVGAHLLKVEGDKNNGDIR